MASQGINIDTILHQIKQLGYLERISLLEKVVSLIKKDTIEKEQTKLSSLSGLGSEIWKNTDIGKYIENERQWE